MEAGYGPALKFSFHPGGNVMCESCEHGFDRRSFLAASSALGAWSLTGGMLAAGEIPASLPARKKDPAKVAVVFLYPPADIVYAGKNEDNWSVHNWFTWPGNQFQPEAQQKKFTDKISEMAKRLGIEVTFEPKGVWQEAKVKEFIAKCQAAKVDAVVVVNFWNTFAARSYDIAVQAAPAAIVYQPVGSNHQLPSQALRTAEGIYYIHSIENWAEIERGLRAVRAKKMLAQSRLLRVTGRLKERAEAEDTDLGTHIVGIPAEEYNSLFDSIQPDDAIRSLAQTIKREAARVMDVTDQYFVDAIRAHTTVGKLLERYGADAITIECLLLKDRKPCVSFAINNGNLVPCGCENQLDGTLTQMLGRWLWDRAGFMHNPDFDTSENHYFGSHCTCAWKLHGPDGPAQPYIVRPFFHQAPKTAAIDAQWPADEPVILAKYYS
ncbi:MAG: hypothetical protein D6741_00030, partial [Planctomycetota bacterium]